MAGLWTLLESQPILTLFLVISVGYAAGEISIAGFRLGVGAVLFIGLLIGAFAPAAAPPAMLSTVGLILFFYGIGIHYGKAFVQGWRSPVGQRQNMIALISTIGAGLVTAAVMRAFNIPAEIGAGLFAGALVNTAALDSVVNKLGSEIPIVGYGVAYPFGVFGPIFCIYLVLKFLRPKIPVPPRRGVQATELIVNNPELHGKLLSDVSARLPTDVQVIAVRQNGHYCLPRGSLRLGAGDELLVEARGESLLCGVIALTMLFLVLQGVQVVASGKRRQVDAHWRRGMSYLKLGGNWIRLAITHQWKIQVFQFLSSLPDPQPALASKRQHEDFFRRESTVLSRIPAS